MHIYGQTYTYMHIHAHTCTYRHIRAHARADDDGNANYYNYDVGDEIKVTYY
jgi:hypothetical protein